MLEPRIYTREEFFNLLPQHSEISSYDDTQLYDYYADGNREIFTNLAQEEVDKILEDNQLGFYYTTIYEKIPEIIEEANHRLWVNNLKDLDKEYVKNIIRNINDTYRVDTVKSETDFYEGYWSGILAACKFLTGKYGSDLDTLRNAEEVLIKNN